MVTRLGELWHGNFFAWFFLAAALAYFLWLGLRLCIIDIRTHTLPNRLLIPAYPVSTLLLVSAALAGGAPGYALNAVGGALAVGGLYFLLWAAYPAGMGLGDVKLAGLLGLFLGFLGWPYVLWGVAAGFLIGGVWSVVLIVSRRGTLTSAIPFGPAMLAGAVLAMVAPG